MKLQKLSDAVVAAFGNNASCYFGKSSGIAFSRKQNECTQNILLFYFGSSKNSQPCASPQRSESCPLLNSMEDDLSSCDWVKSTGWKLGILSIVKCAKKWEMHITYHLPTDIYFENLEFYLLLACKKMIDAHYLPSASRYLLLSSFLKSVSHRPCISQRLYNFYCTNNPPDLNS